MTDTPMKIAEISEILGLSESECRDIAKEYENILPSKKIGRISVYDENTVDKFRKIADLKAQGLPKEVVLSAINGGKTLEERVREDMKKMGYTDGNGPAPVTPPTPKSIPRSETEEELILAVRSLEKTVSSMDHRFSAIRETSEDNMEKILEAISSVSNEVNSLKEQVHELWDQIASLESFLQEQSQKPFWKR